ncbi:MAG: tetratricopeptide repeat protein, partial [Endomicrobia bacterium]|nr:tetratricopeptide repeat protein [Endomicrobiia bacterium]
MKNFAKLIFICLCFCFFVFACDNTGNMLDRADTYHKNGEYDKAESVYQQILKKKPDHPDALK